MNIPSKNAIKLLTQLKNLSKGIRKNKDYWPHTNAPSEKCIKGITDNLRVMITDITEMENELVEKRRTLYRYINENAKTMYVKVRDQVYSIHGKRSERLKDFNLKKLK